MFLDLVLDIPKFDHLIESSTIEAFWGGKANMALDLVLILNSTSLACLSFVLVKQKKEHNSLLLILSN